MSRPNIIRLGPPDLTKTSNLHGLSALLRTAVGVLQEGLLGQNVNITFYGTGAVEDRYY